MDHLTACKTCSGEVAQSATVCPHCGAKLKMNLIEKFSRKRAAKFGEGQVYKIARMLSIYERLSRGYFYQLNNYVAIHSAG